MSQLQLNSSLPITDAIGHWLIDNARSQNTTHDLVTDYDNGEYFYSLGIDTDPNPITIEELITLHRIIRNQLEFIGQSLQGEIRMYSMDNKICLNFVGVDIGGSK